MTDQPSRGIGRPSGSAKTEPEENTTVFLPVRLKRQAEARAVEETRLDEAKAISEKRRRHHRYLRNIIIEGMTYYLHVADLLQEIPAEQRAQYLRDAIIMFQGKET